MGAITNIRARRNGECLVLMGLSLAAGAITIGAIAPSARAAVVVHDNSDGVFKWKLSYRLSGSGDFPGTFLDITQPPTQPTDRRPGTLGVWFRPNISSSTPGIRSIEAEDGAATARTDEPTEFIWTSGGFSYSMSGFTTREFWPGESVSTASWHKDSPFFYHVANSESLSKGTPVISTRAYIGVRTTIQNRTHYGWIYFTDYTTPLMWAYETEPDTPIQIPVPTPGTLTGAMFGVSLALQRRRRA